MPNSRHTTASPPSSKARKTKTLRHGKTASVILDGPLSVLTKDSKIPIKDMESFVNRSTEERLKETEKKNGHIVRPMNAFMMYRSAYADRAKTLFDQNNHQVVSKATGQSWKLEPKEVQDHYRMLSEVERQNHAKAWPNYKFTPSKPGVGARKQKDSDFGSDDEITEQDPSDYDWTPSGPRKPRPQRGVSARKAVEAPRSGSPYPRVRTGCTNTSTPSEWSHGNARHALPVAFDGIHGVESRPQYYTQSVRQHMDGSQLIEDVHFEHMGYPSGQMLGLPPSITFPFADSRHDDPFGSDFHQPHPHAQFREAAPSRYEILDPRLQDFAYRSNGMFTEDGFAEYRDDMLAAHQADARQYPLAQQSVTDIFDDKGFQEWVQSENQQ